MFFFFFFFFFFVVVVFFFVCIFLILSDNIYVTIRLYRTKQEKISVRNTSRYPYFDISDLQY